VSEQRALQLEPADQELSAIESILLVAGGPVSMSALANAIGGPTSHIERLLLQLREKYSRGGIRLQVAGGSAQLVTAPENVQVVQRFLGTAKPAPLSRPSMETLTVIAYHQPVTRAEIEGFRGLNSDRAVLTLLARGLIEERGIRQTLGRPMEFGTSFAFLEYFGLSSLEDLPELASAHAGDFEASGLGLRERH
jgi:segregation and condensation protein B